MNDQTTQAILSRLDALAQKLGVAANALWAIYVRQGIVTGVEDAVFAALAATGSFSLFKFLVPFLVRRHNEADCGDDFGWEMAIVFSCIAGAALAVVFIVFGYDAVAELLNPQFWAIHQIMSDLH